MNQDQSMEEILASIKRVIAEDGGSPATAGRGRAKPAPTGEADAQFEPLELTERADEGDVLELSDPLPSDAGLISDNVTAATRQSLAALAAARPSRQFDPQPQENALEAVVKEMLRPLLKDWLDTRLPELVEEMVAKEIARITGKRG